MTCRTATLLVAGLLAASCTQQPSGTAEPSPSETRATAADPDGASTRAYRRVAAEMHGGMEIDYSGNPDVDFLRGMIPHHQGAVDMARIQIEHGRDPQVRAFAKKMIDAQEAEINQMREWLAKHDAKTPPVPAGEGHGDHEGHH